MSSIAESTAVEYLLTFGRQLKILCLNDGEKTRVSITVVLRSLYLPITLLVMYKLFATAISSIAIAIVTWSHNLAEVGAQEYVFTAPPEVDRQLEEVPASESEYPLYECNSESTDNDEALESHDCNCTDCEDTAQENADEDEVTSQSSEVENKQ